MVADRGYLPVYEPGASLLTSTGLQELTAAAINGEGKDDDDSDIPDDRGRTKAPSKNKDLIALALRPDCVGYCNSAFSLFLMH